MPRLPPALQVFPTLTRFALRPRRLAEVPIGGPSNSVSAQALQQSAIHLYHDLGVLVFAGCSVREVSRIGDVLREVVALGGQGGLVTRLDAWEGEVVRRREEGVEEGDVYKALDEKRTGIIKPTALLRLATTRFEEILKGKLPELKTAKDIDLRETQVMVPASPPPRGILNKTVDGLRRVPIESFTTIGVSRVSGFTIGETRLFTVGSGNYVGGARADYMMLKYSEDKDSKDISVTPYWGHGKLKQRRRASDEAQGAIFDDVVSKVMQPLWDVERSVWAAKAEALEKKNSKEKKEKKRRGDNNTQPKSAA
ncbi:hypothetical protein TsFJ059_005868 [Trichoderma semiorbis]|uniref:Uncharacterized protein n=1 Tax=Trichoderma semiorbis TaxID=1491008 RepID=A0A9P8H9B4_9HYPO|nr:hypothetical protein TsFJ059_005868 [Trichoderma semiorbis]